MLEQPIFRVDTLLRLGYINPHSRVVLESFIKHNINRQKLQATCWAQAPLPMMSSTVLLSRASLPAVDPLRQHRPKVSLPKTISASSCVYTEGAVLLSRTIRMAGNMVVPNFSCSRKETNKNKSYEYTSKFSIKMVLILYCKSATSLNVKSIWLSEQH